MGIAVPIEKARVMKKALKVTVPEMARAITDASMGPTHGVQRSPSVIPRTIPDQKLGFEETVGENREILENNLSVRFWRKGMSRVRPKKEITITEKIRRESDGIPSTLTILERKRVKKVKLRTKPRTVPSGRARDGFVPCLFTPEERTIGRMGKIQGERIVTSPAIKAKSVRIIIIY
ncbi:MAG: hypothetical protein UU94_C0007G0033 [Candidatus Collierbacteria bacterium GW2011_GWB2_42_12]|nr:MAG: hypothetical protein UU94_C0007G0033 [Candidatus Collierbacteria bacterium GW2011_GWB2_42_12]